METTNLDRAKAAAKLARLLIVLAREIGDGENIDVDRTWLREHTLPPDEIEYGAKHAIENLRDISQLISDADDCTTTLGNHPLSKQAKAILFLAREAIGQADVPAQWAMDDGKEEEAVRIVRDALRRGAGRCDKMKLLAADIAAEFAEFKRGPESTTEPAEKPPEDFLSPEVRAIMLIRQRVKDIGKLPTKTAIATMLDVDRRTLQNWTAFKVAYKKLQKELSQNRPVPPRGEKTSDGTLEAWRK